MRARSRKGETMAQYNDDVSVGKIVLYVIGLFFFMIALGWVAQGNEFFLAKFFMPKYEQLRRETYEQSKSYRQGSVQRLNELCKQISDADEGHQPALYSIVAHEFAEWDTKDVPEYLRSCLAT